MKDQNETLAKELSALHRQVGGLGGGAWFMLVVIHDLCDACATCTAAVMHVARE